MKKILLFVVVLILCIFATGTANSMQNSTQSGGVVSQPTTQKNITSEATTSSGQVPMVVPMGSTITVNPTETNPVKVQNEIITSSSTNPATSAVAGGVVPTIVSQVNISNEQQKIEINFNNESKETQISISGGASVSTTQPVQVESSKLYMETSAGQQEIKISPAEASSVVSASVVVEEIKLQESAQLPIYNISGTKEAKIFFLIPVSVPVQTQVSAQTGQVVSVQKPWWSFLAW